MSVFKNKTSVQLKKWNKISMTIAILILVVMFALVLLSLFEVSDGSERAWFMAITPTILLPLIFVPLLFSSAISSEIKKRNSSNS